VTDAAVCVASQIPAQSDQDGDTQEEAVVGEGEAMGEGGGGGAFQEDEDEAACDQHFAALLVCLCTEMHTGRTLCVCVCKQ
jgi:hypothetical protein